MMKNKKITKNDYKKLLNKYPDVVTILNRKLNPEWKNSPMEADELANILEKDNISLFQIINEREEVFPGLTSISQLFMETSPEERGEFKNYNVIKNCFITINNYMNCNLYYISEKDMYKEEENISDIQCFIYDATADTLQEIERDVKITMKQACEVIVKSDIIRKADGTQYTPEEVYNYSSSGELFMIYEWYNMACVALSLDKEAIKEW